MKTKIFALTLAIVMLLCSLVSCGGGGSADEEYIEVELTIEAEEETIINAKVKVYFASATETSPAEKPTVLMAVTQALDDQYISYVADETTITRIASYSEAGNYFWNFTLNGQEAKKGFSTQELKQGDVLVVFFDTFEDEL